MLSKGKNTLILDILNRVSEAQILYYYLGVSKIPCCIHSPLREDKRPSFGIYMVENKVRYTDLATGSKGGLFDLLQEMWGLDYDSTINRIYQDIFKFNTSPTITAYYNRNNSTTTYINNSNTQLKCVVREWEDYDLEYWNSYGITLEWLKWAEVYPISHKVIIKDNHTYTFHADKLAYAYVERKEGNITLKIYQPLNKYGFKWANKHDNSVISLWTKVPKEGNLIVICSSLKDALCLSANTGIPAIAIQGEGYNISNTAIENLKSRYKDICIILDNDKTGLLDGVSLSQKTGFRNIVLPQFEGGKDISDYYKVLNNKKQFKEQMLKLLKI